MGPEKAILPERRDLDRLRQYKILLLVLIALTALLPLLFVERQEPTTRLLVYKYLAKSGSLLATVLFVWQFLLGFRGGISTIGKDLIWNVNFHKHLGAAAAFLLLLHPLFITLYYRDKFDLNLFGFDLSRSFDWFVLLGISALALLIFIYLTSSPLRRFLSDRQWFMTHLTSYLLLPLALIHSFAIGMTVTATPLHYYWLALTAVLTIFGAYRLVFRFGLLSVDYAIVSVNHAADQVVDICLRPLQQQLTPKIGQFIFIRRNWREGARPYTVSSHDPETGHLAITVKAQGGVSSALQQAESGQKLRLDGPYGVFTWQALQSQRPLVMIAGGIGITPFRRLYRMFEHNRSAQAWLFYGNERRADIVYGDELDSLTHTKVVHVLNSETADFAEKGFITTELLRKYLPGELYDYEYLICGPPVMITKLEAELHNVKVPAPQIHHELFGW